MRPSTFKDQVDQALLGLAQVAQEALPLQPSDPKVTRREQQQTRCWCRRPRQRPAKVAIFVLANPTKGSARLLVECMKCHAAWLWGAR